MIKNSKIIIGLIALTLIFGGCAKEPKIETLKPVTSESPAAIKTEVNTPQFGGSLNLFMNSPKTFNPLLNEDASVDSILKIIFLPLSTLDESEKPTVNKAFVENIDFLSDGLSAVIKLKSGKIWSDGKVITSDDLIFTINTLMEAPETVLYKNNVENIISIEAIDDYTAKINFKQPFSGMQYLLNFPIIPEHYYKGEQDPGSEKNMQPIGNGSYKFSKYTLVDSLELVVSENTLTAKPYIENIKVLIMPDDNTRFYAFDQGLLDVVNGDFSEWGKYLASDKHKVVEYLSTYYDFIGFNFDNEVLKEKPVREAIAHSLPYDKLFDEVYLNYAIRTKTPVNPNSWIYEDEVKDRNFDTVAAQTILKDAGWQKDALNSYLVKKNEETELKDDLILKLEILVNVENEERIKIANLLKENLDAIGFSTTVISTDFEDYQNRLKERNFDIFIGGYNLSTIPEFSFMFKSTEANLGENLLNYKEIKMDYFLENAFNAIDNSSYEQTMSELQKYIAEELPLISIAFRKSAIIVNEKIDGEIKPSLDNFYSNINEWFINNNSVAK